MQGGVAPDAEIVLHPPLGWQAVVIPSHRIEDALASHPLVTGDQIRVGVREDMAYVQAAADRRRRGVDRVDLGA